MPMPINQCIASSDDKKRGNHQTNSINDDHNKADSLSLQFGKLHSNNYIAMTSTATSVITVVIMMMMIITMI